MSASSATVEQLMEHLLLDSRFKKQYLSCKSDWDRMEVLLSEAICVSTLNEFGTKLNDGTLEGWHKSSKNVTKLRLEGNAQFAAKKYAAACASYSRALLFSESRDYSVLFANRSAALFHLGEYQACLIDCNRTISDEEYPINKQYKILERCGACLLQLGHPKEARSVLLKSLSALAEPTEHADRMVASSQQPTCDLSSGRQRETWRTRVRNLLGQCASDEAQEPQLDQKNNNNNKKKLTANLTSPQMPNLPSLFGNSGNPHMPAVASVVEQRQVEGMERGLVTVCDLPAGAVVLTEQPYSWILLPDHYLQCCYSCLEPLNGGFYPCRGCNQVAFCNEKCESASWQRASDDSANGHAYECSVFGLVCGGAGMGKLGHLAYRTVCRTPLEDMMQTCCGSSLEDNVFRVASYASAHALTGMSEERNLEDLVRRGAAASVLLRCLHKAGFFQNLPPKVTLSYAHQVVATCLLHNLQSLPCNAHEISAMRLPTNALHTTSSSSDNSAGALEAENVELGAALYPCASLLNHSCDPNVVRLSCRQSVYVCTLTPVRAGSQLLDNYGVHYALQNRDERHEYLQRQYLFDCACAACSANWPLYVHLKCPFQDLTYERLFCSFCDARRSLDENACCTVCLKPHSRVIAETRNLSLQLPQLMRDLMAWKFAAAEPALKTLLTRVEGLFKLPCKLRCDAQECLKLIWKLSHANCLPKSTLALK